MSGSDPFAVRSDLSGRRWTYRLPLLRVSLSVFFLLQGIILLPVGLALPSLACTVIGALSLLPGGFATYSYYLIYRGTFTGNYSTFLDTVELEDEQPVA